MHLQDTGILDFLRCSYSAEWIHTLFTGKLIKHCSLHPGSPHGLPCGDFAGLPECKDFLPVIRQGSGRPSEVFAFGLRGVNTLALPLMDGQALLFGDRAEDFNQNVVDHLEYPFLSRRQVHHGGWQVDHLEMDIVFLEPLQFAVNVGLAAAEPVERLYDKRIAGAQHGRLERLIAGTVKVFAGLLIRDDFSIICAERAKGLELTIKILLACGNAGVVERFVHHITSKKCPERSYAFRTFPFIADGPFRTGFCCGFALSEKVDLVGYLVVIDKVGEQADNGQYAENDFASR